MSGPHEQAVVNYPSKTAPRLCETEKFYNHGECVLEVGAEILEYILQY